MQTTQAKVGQRSDLTPHLIFDEARFPDYAFLSPSELAEVFQVSEKTLRKFHTERGFPPPMEYPWGNAYNVGAIREFLRGFARQGVTNVKISSAVEEGGKAVKNASGRATRGRILKAL